MHDKLLDGIAEQGAKFTPGHPLRPGTLFGPLISEEQFQRVSGFIDAGQKSGANLWAGGRRIGNAG